ncbi:unnamed protein product [Cercospora beticola]|nr:unnamed protein product [Cercospora beticola]
MAIRAPWKGFVGRVGMPILSALVVANTLAILILSIFNAAAVELNGDGRDFVKDRAVLVLFWCTVPFVLSITTITELFCLWSDRLAPVWALISSSVAICIGAAQMGLWQPCVSTLRTSSKPDFCPSIYKTNENNELFFSWYHASASAPAAAIPTIFIIYLIQISLAAIVVHKQRRYAFRKSDLVRPWKREHDDVSKITYANSARSSRTVSASEQERMLYPPSPPQSMRSSSSSELLSAGSSHAFSGFSGTWYR